MDNIILMSITKEELIIIIKECITQELNEKKQKEMLTFKETCEFLGCSASGLNKWKAQNLIPYKKLGKRIYFQREELLKSLKDSNCFRRKEI